MMEGNKNQPVNAFTAYVRPVVMRDGRKAQAVYTADGTMMAIIEGREEAFVTLRRHEMVPQSVH